MKFKSFSLLSVFLLFLFLLFNIAFISITDPYFHYHKPLSFLSYEMSTDNARYLNYGIAKHFNYDTVIIGSSLTANTKPSELSDSIFGDSIKVINYGSTIKENYDLLNTILLNRKVKNIIWGLDFSRLLCHKDEMVNFSLPEYLYDDSIFNDVNYLLNIDVLLDELNNINHTISKKKSTTFDEYANWSDENTKYGKEILSTMYWRTTDINNTDNSFLDDDLKRRIDENLKQNIISLVQSHPETNFILFIPPQSIYFFDSWYAQGMLKCNLDAHNYIISRLASFPNIQLYSFFYTTEWCTNLENYKDISHYGEWINSGILQDIKTEKNQINQDNIDSISNYIKDFYLSFDYNSLFK